METMSACSRSRRPERLGHAPLVLSCLVALLDGLVAQQGENFYNPTVLTGMSVDMPPFKELRPGY